MQTERLFFLDVMKGIAILGVVFFHANIFKKGYLGVDLFFFISGYLKTKSIFKQYNQKTNDKIIRQKYCTKKQILFSKKY